MSIPSLAVSWEAVYDHGHIDREVDGVKYGSVDRNRLKSFRLVAPGEILAEVFCHNGVTGWNLAYRRRTMMQTFSAGGGGKEIWFIIGMVPMGPIIAVQPETLRVRKADRFESGAGPLGVIHPRKDEGEHWDWRHMLHKSDAVLTPQKIQLGGYEMKVV